jgi:hypothetical protein
MSKTTDKKFKSVSSFVDTTTDILIFPIDKIFGTNIKDTLKKYKWGIMVVCILCLILSFYSMIQIYL